MSKSMSGVCGVVVIPLGIADFIVQHISGGFRN